MMAKLIKSILANRMMFRGGGLVAPSHAGGILASSSPLIDSVAMNQGGPVNFVNGGIALGPGPLDVTSYTTPVLDPIQSVPVPLSPPTNIAENIRAQHAVRRQQIAGSIASFVEAGKPVADIKKWVMEQLGIGDAAAGSLMQEVMGAIDATGEKISSIFEAKVEPIETGPSDQAASLRGPDIDDEAPTSIADNIAQNAAEVTAEYLSTKAERKRQGRVRVGDRRTGPYKEDTSFSAVREQNPYTSLIGKTEEDFPTRRGVTPAAQRVIRELNNQGMTAQQASAAWNDSAYKLFSDMVGVEHTPAADPELAGHPLGGGGIKGKSIVERRKSAEQLRIDQRRLLAAAESSDEIMKLRGRRPQPVEVNGQLFSASEKILKDWVSSGEANADAESALIDTLLAKIGGRKEEDIDDIKGTIEALMPAAEKSDDKTLGLLLARFGAALMATPGNFLEAVGKVGNDHIGDFINYQEGIKEKERERELAISKLAITEKLSRDKEGRDLTTYIQKGIIDEEIEGLTPKNYILPSQVLSATVFDPNASPNDIVNIPGSIMSFDESSAQKLMDAGVSMIAEDVVDLDYADYINLVGGATAVDVEDEKDAAELINKYSKTDPMTLLKGHMNQGDGVQVDTYLMNPAGAQILGMSGRVVLDKDMHAFTADVHRANSKIGALMSLVNTLDDIKHKDLVGFGLFKGNLKSALRGFSEGAGEGSIRKQIAHAIAKATGVKELYDPEGKPTGGQLYEVNARFLMTQIAPMLLGESGKTISDADRVLVAQALGWRNARKDQKGIFQLGDYDATYLKDASVIRASLDQVRGALQRHQASLLSEYSKFARSATIASSADTRGLFSKNWKKLTQSGSDYFNRMMELTGGIEQAAEQIFTTDISKQGDQFSIVQDYTI